MNDKKENESQEERDLRKTKIPSYEHEGNASEIPQTPNDGKLDRDGHQVVFNEFPKVHLKHSRAGEHGMMRAIGEFGEDKRPERLVHEMPVDRLCETIRPCFYFRVP